jgi:hypothetical protein
MSGKRGGKKESAAVEEDAKVEAEAQALIQEQIDTTDVDGAFLRGLLVDITNEEDVVLVPLQEEQRNLDRVDYKLTFEMNDLFQREANGEDVKNIIKEKGEILKKIRDKKSTINTEIENKKKEYSQKQRELFYIDQKEKSGINLSWSVLSGIGKYEEAIKPQKEFIEKVWVPHTNNKNIDIEIKGTKGFGGFSDTNKSISVGREGIKGTTVVLHELFHQVESRNMGRKRARRDAAIALILKRTGKEKIEDVEIESMTYTDSSGKIIVARDKTNRQNVFIPSGVFKSDEEREKYSYAMRVYESDTEIRNGVRYINRNPSEGFGVEIPAVGIQQIYENPGKFAKEAPDMFDLTVNQFRGKLTL